MNNKIGMKMFKQQIIDKQIEWVKTIHWSMKRSYQTQYRCKNYGFFKVETVQRNKWGFPTGKESVKFYLNNKSNKVFKSEADLLTEYQNDLK